MAYSDKVIDHYENPRNVGGFDKGDDSVGTGMVGAPACGDVMKLQIKVNPATGLIEDARFKTYGCGSAIASSSLVTEWVKGKSLDEAMAIRNTHIAEELALPQPKVLNLASSMMPLSSLTLICSFITSPHSGAPTMPVPTLPALLSREPTLRGLL